MEKFNIDPNSNQQSFTASTSFRYAVFHKTIYRTLCLGIDYAVNRWYLHLSIPYVDNTRQRMTATSDRMEVSGLGDISFMAWYNLTAKSKPVEKETPVQEKDVTKPEEKKEQIQSDNPLVILVGAGLKLATGDDSVHDRLGVFPPELQPGSGTVDKLFGVTAVKKVLGATGFIGTVYQLTGGTNSIHYEKKDRAYWNAGLTYELSKKNRLNLSLALNGVDIWEEDRNNGIKVPNTKGDWIYFSPSISINPFEKKNISFGLGFDYAVKEPSSSIYGMKRCVTVSASLGF